MEAAGGRVRVAGNDVVEIHRFWRVRRYAGSDFKALGRVYISEHHGAGGLYLRVTVTVNRPGNAAHSFL